MGGESKRLIGLFSRYFFIVFLGLGNLYIFYKVLTPLTVGSLKAILSIFREVSVSGNLIRLESTTIEIIPACVAGAAFYLLFILVFSTAKIPPKKRFYMILISSLVLFALNIIRMLFLITLLNSPIFGTIHWILWNFVSTIFVVAIWVGLVYIYRIKTISIYSDLTYMFELVRKSKKSHRKN